MLQDPLKFCVISAFAVCELCVLALEKTPPITLFQGKSSKVKVECAITFFPWKSVMARVHTVFPGYIPTGFYDEDNIHFIQNRVVEILKMRFIQDIIIDRASIIRVMQRVHSERLESIPKMNQRVLMYLTNSFITHQEEADKHLRWEDAEFGARQLYDVSAKLAATDVTYGPKFPNRLGTPSVGGTSRFYFT